MIDEAAAPVTVWNVAVAESWQSGDSVGSYAGVWALAMSRVTESPLVGDERLEARVFIDGQHDVAGLVVRLSKDNACFSGCARGSDCVGVFQCSSDETRRGARLVGLAADISSDPNDRQQSKWVDQLQAILITPKRVEGSFWQGSSLKIDGIMIPKTLSTHRKKGTTVSLMARRLAAAGEQRWHREASQLPDVKQLPPVDHLRLEEGVKELAEKVRASGYVLPGHSKTVYCRLCERASSKGLQRMIVYRCKGTVESTDGGKVQSCLKKKSEIHSADDCASAAKRRRWMKNALEDSGSRDVADDEVSATAGDISSLLPTAAAAELPATQEWPNPSYRVVKAGGQVGCWRSGAVAGHKPLGMLAGVRRGLTAEGAEDLVKMERGVLPLVRAPAKRLTSVVLPLVSASVSDINGDGALSTAGPSCHCAPRVDGGDPAGDVSERAKKKRRGVGVAGIK